MERVEKVDTVALLKECGAFLEGHFLLSSGRHSDRYFQCARLLQYPGKAAEALAPVAAAIREAAGLGVFKVDAIVGPAMGGIIVAYELGRQLGLPAFFTERDDSGGMTLRRGFEVSGGMNILIAEDVVTTGKSSAECAAVLEERGACVSALACVVDRRVNQSGESGGLPLFAAAKITVSGWDAPDCPLCKRGIPFVKPGSRKFFY
ncbi:MAG: orotate phosphoribosyltransferase [Spirochaetaceae bacterium]|jgi:orotate phosphoribosyltransferase|nr:orotate phosphoribosyltransferase [Spirochaetaceae bacterium]